MFFLHRLPCYGENILFGVMLYIKISHHK